MNVTWRLAWRNLWRHGRRTWLTVSAMIFCNALLIFMISLQLGSYTMMIDGTLAALSGHLQIQHPDYNTEPRMRDSVAGGVSLAENLRAATGIESIAARASSFALASSEERSFGMQIIGVQPHFEPLVSSLPGLVSEGRYLRNHTAAEIVLGSVLARNLKVSPGDEITFMGTGRDGSFAAGIATLVGIVHSGALELDRALAEVPLAYFSEVFAMNDEVHSLVIKLPALAEVDQTRLRLEPLLNGSGLAVRDWDELQPGLRQAIQADLFSAFFMYGVLIALVAFSVLNTQLMSVLERTREFGVMLSLGVRPGALGRLVLLETALMSSLGLVLGCALGSTISAWFNRKGFYIPGMEEAMAQYNLPGSIYPELSLVSVFLGPAVVFLGGLLAAVYPALRLHSLQPVEAMRAS